MHEGGVASNGKTLLPRCLEITHKIQKFNAGGGASTSGGTVTSSTYFSILERQAGYKTTAPTSRWLTAV